MIGKPEIGKKFLITCDNWFYAPDGHQYRAVFGTVNAVMSDQETLGITTNRHSTNWYLSVGNVLIAGCQIHYALRTDSVSLDGAKMELEHKGKIVQQDQPRPRVYIAEDIELVEEKKPTPEPEQKFIVLGEKTHFRLAQNSDLLTCTHGGWYGSLTKNDDGSCVVQTDDRDIYLVTRNV